MSIIAAMPEGTAARPAVFFDRDNTLIVASEYLGDPKGVVLMDDAVECVAGAHEMGFATITISNQSGVARGYFTEKDVRAVNRRLDEMLRERDRRAIIDRHEFCPHHPTHGVAPYRQACQCRKPRDGMIRRAATAMKLDLGQSWLIGDAPRDIEAGAAAGLRTILLNVEGIRPSPAATTESRIEPDFEVGSLREALWVIAKETGKQLPAMTREQQELDELDDDEESPPQVELDDDDQDDEDALPDAAAGIDDDDDDDDDDEQEDLNWPQDTPREPVMSTADEARHRPGTSVAEAEPDHLPSGAAPERAFASQRQAMRSPGGVPDPATADRIAATTAQILDDIRRQRETPREDFNFYRLLAGVVQVLAVAAVVWAVVTNFNEPRLLLAVFLQVMTLTLVSASGR